MIESGFTVLSLSDASCSEWHDDERRRDERRGVASGCKTRKNQREMAFEFASLCMQSLEQRSSSESSLSLSVAFERHTHSRCRAARVQARSEKGRERDASEAGDEGEYERILKSEGSER